MDLLLPQEMLFEILKYLDYDDLMKNKIRRYPFLSQNAFWIFKLYAEYPQFDVNSRIPEDIYKYSVVLIKTIFNIDILNYTTYTSLPAYNIIYFVYRLTTLKGFYLGYPDYLRYGKDLQPFDDIFYHRNQSFKMMDRIKLLILSIYLNIDTPISSLLNLVQFSNLSFRQIAEIFKREDIEIKNIMNLYNKSKQSLIDDIISKLTLGML